MENALIEDYEVLISHSGKEALSICNSNDPPDLILLDIIMPEIDGYEICKRLNRGTKTKDIPVIFLTSLTESRDIEFGLTLGAIDYITKPFSIPIIKAKIKNHLALKYYQDTLKINTDVDQLTQIANRRRFDDTMTLEIKKAKRTGTILSVLLLDIDHFKFYNDTYGHLEGDACLKKVASALSSSLKRPKDLAARWGGEEFACLLPNTNAKGAQNVAEALREAIQKLGIPHKSSPGNEVVTVSVGVVSSNPMDENSFDNLLKQADEALYQAKKTGRNRIALWHQEIEAIEPD
jgi:diguanylate cyclase (GGDEF)-like protein